MSAKKYSFTTKLLYTIIVVLVFLFIAESIASIAEYQKKRKYPLAIIGLFANAYHSIRDKRSLQKLYHAQQLVRPDSSATINNLIKDENGICNRSVYEPWVQFRNTDFSSKYVNVHGLNRETIPFTAGSQMNTDTVTIFFLGGSTMFGFNVADNETIPSYFTKWYQQKFNAAKPIKVLNYGNPYYYSYQELMLLTNLIYTGNIPDIIVVLDGLNDCLQIRSSIQRVPIFSDLFKQSFNPDILKKGYVDSTAEMYKPPVGVDLSVYSKNIFNNLIENIGFMKSFASLYQVQLFCFIQPVPQYHYPNRKNDPMVSKEELPQFDFIYPLLKQKSGETKDFFFLGEMLENEKGYPFVDQYHYSPEMNKKIALEILNKIQPTIQSINKRNSVKK